MLDFTSILSSCGFTADRYDFESTIIGFDYDLHTALLDVNTPFDIDLSQSYRQWEKPNELIRAELKTRDGDIDSGITYFFQKWLKELRYDKPLREIIDVNRQTHSATLHVLTISQHNAVTLLLEIS